MGASLGCVFDGKKGTSGGGTVRTRKDGTKEARLLVPQEYRGAVGRTYLYFYGKTEKEAKRKRTAAERDMIRRGPRAFNASRVCLHPRNWRRIFRGSVRIRGSATYFSRPSPTVT